MDIKTIAANIGREADLRTADFTAVRVRITDAKLAYGQVRYTVVPVNGQGSATVDSCRVVNISPRPFEAGMGKDGF